MAVTPRDVRHVAELARLGLDPAEVEELTRQLNGILEHMEELQAVDVSGVTGEHEADGAARGGSGAEAAAAEHAPLRSDDPAADPLAFAPAELAPAWEDGFFVVPRLASHDEAAADPDAGPGETP